MGKRRTGDPTKAVAYIRVSTEEQHLGPEAQRHDISAWAARAGVEVVAWHEDRLTGATPAAKREGLLAALADLRLQGAGLLVAAKRDRLGRDVIINATIERLTVDAGARVVTADGVAPESTAEGALMRTLLDAFSQYERARIRGRVAAAMAVKRRRGEFLGTCPLGQARAGKLLEADEHEQVALARIRELRSEGLSVRAIADRLNSDRVPARGTRWFHPGGHGVPRGRQRDGDPEA